MAADFGINAKLIQDSALQGELDKISECLKKSGIDLTIDLSVPGLGALIATLVRTIEKAIVSSFEPLIALISTVMEALDAGIEAITVFIEKVAKLVSAIAELLANLPMSIIEFIVNKIIEPIIKNINIPFPSIEALIQILTFQIKLPDIDWDDWYKKGWLIIPQKLIDKGKKFVDEALQLFKSVADGIAAAFLKIIELLMFPIKIAMDLIKKVVEFVSGLVTNIFDTIKSLLEIIKNPVQWVLDFIGDLFADILSGIMALFVAIEIPDLNEFKKWVKEFIGKLFKIGSIKFDIDEWLKEVPEPYKSILETIIGFLKLLQCFILWIISLLSPATILGLFFPLGADKMKMPPMKMKSYTSSTREIIIDDPGTKLSDVFAINDNISFVHKTKCTLNGVIISMTENSLIIKDDPAGENDESGGGEVKKI
jgi:hypothetical protein